MANKTDKKSASKASAFQKKTATKPVDKTEKEKVEESKAKAFKQKRDTKTAPLHASEPEIAKPKAKSFSFYPTDFKTLEKVQELLADYSNRGMSESVVARTALNYLKYQLDNESKKANRSAQFEDTIKRIIQESK
jgi:hypothetical protein